MNTPPPTYLDARRQLRGAGEGGHAETETSEENADA